MSSTGVVETLDVLTDRVDGRLPRRPCVAVEQLLLERSEEALDDCVDAPIDVKRRFFAVNVPVEAPSSGRPLAQRTA